MNTPTAKDVAAIIGHVGEIVGRTKLQKIAALLELAGLGAGFKFSYHHYGPYSEELTTATDRAALLGLIQETPRQASWGGHYSIFSAPLKAEENPARAQLIEIAADANAVALELAVTAAFIAHDENAEDAWYVVANRKPEKASEENLKAARDLYKKFRSVNTTSPLPLI